MAAATSHIQGHSCERARHCKRHCPGTRHSRHETLYHRAYELIEAYVSEFEAEPATKYLTRYFSLYEATVGLKRLLFLGCRAPTLLGRISETAHYEADARCTWGGVFLTCAFFYASDMQVPHVGAWIFGQLFIDCSLVFIFFILICNEI